MTSPQNGRRTVRVTTQALVALAVAGTVGGSVLAFADTQPAKAAASTPTATSPSGSGTSSGSRTVSPGPSTGSSSSSNGGGFSAVPPLSSGSGRSHATSSGS